MLEYLERIEALKLRSSYDEKIFSDAQMEKWNVEDKTFAERVIAWFAGNYAEVWDVEGNWIGGEMESEI